MRTGFLPPAAKAGQRPAERRAGVGVRAAARPPWRVQRRARPGPSPLPGRLELGQRAVIMFSPPPPELVPCSVREDSPGSLTNSSVTPGKCYLGPQFPSETPGPFRPSLGLPRSQPLPGPRGPRPQLTP